jgi:hypothetical protein
MNKRIIALIGVSIFAITLAIVIGISLTGEALMIALGIAIGVIIGIPVGAVAMTLGLRVQSQSSPNTQLTLTPKQADQLMRALERPQTSPGSFSMPAHQERQISMVGGAELVDTFDDSQ